MSFLQEVKDLVGEAVFKKLDQVADNQVGLAKECPLTDDFGVEKYFTPQVVFPELIDENLAFFKAGLTITPSDIVPVLFQAKLIQSASDEYSYAHRIGGFNRYGNTSLVLPVKWEEKGNGYDLIIDRHIENLRNEQKSRTLVVDVNNFMPDLTIQQQFFDELFASLKLPFSCYWDENVLIEKYKVCQPGLRTYTIDDARQYFSAPSIGHTVFGSNWYCYWYSSSCLKIMLSLVRIGGFIHPPQIDFGQTDLDIVPPIAPTFLGSNSKGGYCWDEDKKAFWERSPDGSLLQSFGFRAVSKMYLDQRNLARIKSFILDHKAILNDSTNPWSKQALFEIYPILDLLSNVTLAQDLGTKILLLYCCLEHLFVPKGETANNLSLIKGGIYALAPELLSWFTDELYKQRCEYAHKGYIVKKTDTLPLIQRSVGSVMHLLLNKIKLRTN